MRNYECMVILEPALETDALDALIAKFSDVALKNGGKIENVNKWGKRRLAHQIGQNTDGYYAVFDLLGENQTISELDRILKITDGVIRHMIIRQGK
ncbi:MAG: 30S ribosomal protein S6 [Candidatus Aquicultor primus]|uniref:Small ribosomal subunit protein bS6 n=1 Tax=Candidatus Aquicultor primus TaxID=1797195 RepID=A0A1F2UP64_9ACTN|nr:MAG: 30S ribosomal protein S6 [Candidatus Aquicultor primus]HCH00087.1 30S ribosomal protein S6 [Actinomycetota bacterium]